MKKWVIGLACVAMGVATAMGQDPAVWFNEINYDPAGTDDAGTEWLEVAGPAGVDLSSYVVVLYNGANGGSYGTTTLSGTIDDEGCGYGAVELTYGAANSLQNGAPDGMALASVSAGVTTLVQFLSYEGTFTATNGPATGLTSVSIGTQNNAANTLQLSGTATNYGGFTWATNTASKGSLNVGQAFTGCTPTPPTNVSFTASAAAVDETPGTYVVTVMKSLAVGDVSGSVALSGTATEGAGADYTVDTTNFTMNGATTSATFTVTINDDADVESAETVVLTLSGVVGGTVVAPSVFTLTINASDIPSHAIAITPSTNGTVTTTPADTAQEGSTVTINTTPDSGYRVASITVLDGSATPVAVAGNTFVMPTSDVTVTVLFEVYAAPDVLIDFEDYTGTYSSNDYSAGGVIWAMTNAFSGTTAGSDRFHGTTAGRFENNRGGSGRPAIMRSSAFAQPINKVSFWYANYAANDGGKFKVQVSSDGSSWQDLGSEYDPITNAPLVEAVIDTIPASMTYLQIITTTGSAQRVNIDDVGLWFGAATFGVTFNRTNGFVVAEGAGDTITATAANGVGPYSYSWTSTLGEGYRTADSNLFTILTNAPIGVYTSTVVATDSDAPAKSVTNTVTFQVAAPAAKYPITITTNAPANGTVTTTPAGEAEAGQTVTITATPVAGYAVDTITATESGGGTSLPIVNKTFVMTNAGVVVAVTFKEATTSGALIISQYYEGTSNNKWIEIYNPGSTTIDLLGGGYRLGTWNNAAREAWKTNGTPTLAVVLSNSIAAGATYLVSYTTVSNPAYATANQTANLQFNGDDSVAIYTGATYDFANVVDAFGMTATNASDRSFVRKSSVTVGVNTDFNAADWDEFTNTQVDEAAESTNERLGYHSTGAPVFSVALDRANGFTVAQGASAAITATATNGTPGYTYSWTSSLGPSYYTTNANVFTISASAPLGTYTSTVTATDSTLATAEKSVYFSVTGAPPSGAWISVVGSRSGTLGVQMDLTITLSNSVTPAANWYIDLKDPDLADDFSYAFDDVTGAFSLVPAKTGNYSLTATATDSGDALLAATNVTLTVGADTVWTIGSGTGAAMFTTLTNIIIVLPTNYTLSAVLGGGASAAGLNGLGQGLGTLAPEVDYTWTPSNRTVNVFNTVTNRRFVRIRATTP